MSTNYQLALLCLTHLLISADGVIDDVEIGALQHIREKEKISEDVFREFEALVSRLKERDIYQVGIEYINRCTEAEKLRAFVTLYKLSEADGRVHVKEIRLLLYSIKMASIEFEDVVMNAKNSPSIFL